MLGIIGNLHMMELLVIALAALMIFGRRLPEVALRGAAQIVRLRRSVTKMWREAGLEEELRKVRRDIDREVHQVQRSLPSLTAQEEDVDDDPEHEHWRADIHSEISTETSSELSAEISADEGPLTHEALDGEPSEEAIRQEGEMGDAVDAVDTGDGGNTGNTGDTGDTGDTMETDNKESA